MGRVVTSGALGPMLGMNLVVVRRTIAGPRGAGVALPRSISVLPHR
jgi:hypothetical protein